MTRTQIGQHVDGPWRRRSRFAPYWKLVSAGFFVWCCVVTIIGSMRAGEWIGTVLVAVRRIVAPAPAPEPPHREGWIRS